jgi:hypothetical protein
VSDNKVTVGEFAKKVTAFAEDCSNDAKDGKAALIIIGVDASQDDHNSAVIGIVGKNVLILEGLTKFLGQTEHLEMVKEALAFSALTKIMQIGTSQAKEAEPQEAEPQEVEQPENETK